MVILSSDPAGKQIYVCNADNVSWSLVGDGAPGAATSGDITAAVATETTRAQGAESTLTTNLSNEVTRASSAESTITGNLNNEITRATGAEPIITGNLNNEIT